MGNGVLRRWTAILLTIVFVCWGCSGQHSSTGISPAEETEPASAEVLGELAKTPVPA